MTSTTSRLDLAVPVEADLDALHGICRDPRGWTHYPSLRHAHAGATERMLKEWILQWDRDELGVWVARTHDSTEVVGYGGCSIRRDHFWNLGYRFAVDHQGMGYATEVSRAAVDHARRVWPDLPVVAGLLEHNAGSARVAEKVGLTVVDRLHDFGNPDPEAIRLVYSDQTLTDDQRHAVVTA